MGGKSDIRSVIYLMRSDNADTRSKNVRMLNGHRIVVLNLRIDYPRTVKPPHIDTYSVLQKASECVSNVHSDMRIRGRYHFLGATFNQP